MKYMYLLLSTLMMINSNVHAFSDENVKEVKDKTELSKIISTIEREVPELKKMASESFKKTQDTYYAKYTMKHAAKLLIKDKNDVMKKNNYLVSYGDISVPGEESENPVALLYVSKDLKKITFPDYSTEKLKLINIADWRKIIQDKNAQQQAWLKKNPEENLIRTELKKSVKLDKKKELLQKGNLQIQQEELNAYIKEVVPFINLNEEYYKMIRPNGEITFKLLYAPNPKAKHDLEKNYYAVEYIYQGADRKERLFIPVSLDEKKILVENVYLTSVEKKDYKNSKYIVKYETGGPDGYLTYIAAYFKKHPEKKAKPDQEIKKMLTSYFTIK